MSGSDDATLKLWHLETRKPVATMTTLIGDTWVVTADDGRFDTNQLENTKGLIWIMADAPLAPIAFEAFMRDYYEPNLLPRLLNCSTKSNCDREFKPVRDLTDLNRAQPVVNTKWIKPTVPRGL